MRYKGPVSNNRASSSNRYKSSVAGPSKLGGKLSRGNAHGRARKTRSSCSAINPYETIRDHQKQRRQQRKRITTVQQAASLNLPTFIVQSAMKAKGAKKRFLATIVDRCQDAEFNPRRLRRVHVFNIAEREYLRALAEGDQTSTFAPPPAPVSTYQPNPNVPKTIMPSVNRRRRKNKQKVNEDGDTTEPEEGDEDSESESEPDEDNEDEEGQTQKGGATPDNLAQATHSGPLNGQVSSSAQSASSSSSSRCAEASPTIPQVSQSGYSPEATVVDRSAQFAGQNKPQAVSTPAGGNIGSEAISSGGSAASYSPPLLSQLLNNVYQSEASNAPPPVAYNRGSNSSQAGYTGYTPPTLPYRIAESPPYVPEPVRHSVVETPLPEVRRQDPFVVFGDAGYNHSTSQPTSVAYTESRSASSLLSRLSPMNARGCASVPMQATFLSQSAPVVAFAQQPTWPNGFNGSNPGTMPVDFWQQLASNFSTPPTAPTFGAPAISSHFRDTDCDMDSGNDGYSMPQAFPTFASDPSPNTFPTSNPTFPNFPVPSCAFVNLSKPSVTTQAVPDFPPYAAAAGSFVNPLQQTTTCSPGVNGAGPVYSHPAPALQPADVACHFWGAMTNIMGPATTTASGRLTTALSFQTRDIAEASGLANPLPVPVHEGGVLPRQQEWWTAVNAGANTLGNNPGLSFGKLEARSRKVVSESMAARSPPKKRRVSEDPSWPWSSVQLPLCIRELEHDLEEPKVKTSTGRRKMMSNEDFMPNLQRRQSAHDTAVNYENGMCQHEQQAVESAPQQPFWSSWNVLRGLRSAIASERPTEAVNFEDELRQHEMQNADSTPQGTFWGANTWGFTQGLHSALSPQIFGHQHVDDLGPYDVGANMEDELRRPDAEVVGSSPQTHFWNVDPWSLTQRLRSAISPRKPSVQHQNVDDMGPRETAVNLDLNEDLRRLEKEMMDSILKELFPDLPMPSTQHGDDMDCEFESGSDSGSMPTEESCFGPIRTKRNQSRHCPGFDSVMKWLRPG